MKWAQQNLATFMRRSDHALLTEYELREPALKIIYALRNIHKVGFLHNNINPSNILVIRKYLPHKVSIKVKLSGLSKTIPMELVPHV